MPSTPSFTTSTSFTPTSTASIPLTTIFTPSSGCLSDYWLYTLTETGIYPYGYVSVKPSNIADCLPPHWDSSSQYFSPGLCPSGYVIACSSTIAIGSVSETHAQCCPSGNRCVTSYGAIVNPTHDWRGPVYATNPCIGPDSITVNITTVEDSTTYISKTTLVGGAFGYGVSVRFQPTDFATSSGHLVPLPSPSPSPSPTSSSSSFSSTAIFTPTPTPIPSHHGLSKGAVAGISVGVILAAIFAAVLLTCCIVGRKNNVRSTKSEDTPTPGNNLNYGPGTAHEEPVYEPRTGIISA